MLRPLLAAALAAGALLTMPADAATRCLGEHSRFYVCVVSQDPDPARPLPMGEIEVYCGGALCPGQP